MISKERLCEIIEFSESFGRHPKLHECAEMAKEIISLRSERHKQFKWCVECSDHPDWPPGDYYLYDHEHEADEKIMDVGNGRKFIVYIAVEDKP